MGVAHMHSDQTALQQHAAHGAAVGSREFETSVATVGDRYRGLTTMTPSEVGPDSGGATKK